MCRTPTAFVALTVGQLNCLQPIKHASNLHHPLQTVITQTLKTSVCLAEKFRVCSPQQTSCRSPSNIKERKHVTEASGTSYFQNGLTGIESRGVPSYTLP